MSRHYFCTVQYQYYYYYYLQHSSTRLVPLMRHPSDMEKSVGVRWEKLIISSRKIIQMGHLLSSVSHYLFLTGCDWHLTVNKLHKSN